VALFYKSYSLLIPLHLLDVWGVADIKAAVKSISHWMGAVGWSGPRVLAEDWMVVGHSNGGMERHLCS
jgi:hypothetical protein